MRLSNTSHKFLPALSQMEARECPAVVCTASNGILQILGDRTDNVIDISSSADGSFQVVGDGQSFSFTGIQSVRVATFDGNDTVRLTLNEGTKQFGINFYADLGGGDDSFALTVVSTLPPIYSPVSPTSAINVNVAGSVGNDSLVAQFKSADPAALATLVPAVKLALDGGDGNDRLMLACNNLVLRGRMDATMTGDAGNDTVAQDFHGNNWFAPLNLVASGGDGDDVMDTEFDSTGPRSVYNALIGVSIAGDAGNDLLNFNLGAHSSGGGGAGTGERGNTTDPVVNVGFNFTLDGGDGNDVATAWAVVAPQGAGNLNARVLGGNGDDNLTLDLSAIPPLFHFTGLIDGGAGFDTHTSSPTVTVVNCEA